MTRRSIAGICRKDGRYFVAKRAPGGDLGGKWEFPGGKVEDGETDQEALIREYYEEFGLRIEVRGRLCGVEFSHAGKGYTLGAYLILMEDGIPALREHTETGWADEEQIAQLDFADSDKKILPYLRESFGED
jgi:8-oxo-dGTP diphosphatase